VVQWIHACRGDTWPLLLLLMLLLWLLLLLLWPLLLLRLLWVLRLRVLQGAFVLPGCTAEEVGQYKVNQQLQGGGSEVALVGGSRCVCGGCRIARWGPEVARWFRVSSTGLAFQSPSALTSCAVVTQFWLNLPMQAHVVLQQTLPQQGGLSDWQFATLPRIWHRTHPTPACTRLTHPVCVQPLQVLWPQLPGGTLEAAQGLLQAPGSSGSGSRCHSSSRHLVSSSRSSSTAHNS
jgi:hypothetical protein